MRRLKMIKNHITYERANQLLRYDPETGKLFWKVRKKGGKGFGGEAGYLNKSIGYMYVGIDNYRCLVHRIIWLLHYGYAPDCQIDHINRDRADNRIENLRLATRNESDNHQNRSLPSNNKSGVIGVSWHKAARKWCVEIWVDKVKHYIGLFENFEDAVIARKAAESRYHTFANS
jgi:hypothetical protein